MTRFTKKYMVEDYERLRDHANLLEPDSPRRRSRAWPRC